MAVHGVRMLERVEEEARGAMRALVVVVAVVAWRLESAARIAAGCKREYLRPLIRQGQTL